MPTALITGASRGLGLGLARALADDGWRLVLDARGAADLQAAARGLADPAEVVALPGDVTDPERRAALVAAAGSGIDLLVNNASTLGPSPRPPLASHPIDALAEGLRSSRRPDATTESVRRTNT